MRKHELYENNEKRGGIGLTISKVLQNKIMNVMGDGITRDISSLKKELAEREEFEYGKDYKEGHLAGVLRGLAGNGELDKIERGVYRLGRKESLMSVEMQKMRNAAEKSEGLGCQTETPLEKLREETIASLEKEYNNLVASMSGIMISSLNPADFENTKQLLELREGLKKILNQYRYEE